MEPLDTGHLKPQSCNESASLNSFHNKTLAAQELNQILTYYENHKTKFKNDQENKLVVIRNSTISIKQGYLKELMRVIENQNAPRKSNTQQNFHLKKFEQLSQTSLVQTIQDIVNEGELQVAYFMFLVLRDKVKFPDNTPKLWSQAYIGISCSFL